MTQYTQSFNSYFGANHIVTFSRREGNRGSKTIVKTRSVSGARLKCIESSDNPDKVRSRLDRGQEVDKAGNWKPGVYQIKKTDLGTKWGPLLVSEAGDLFQCEVSGNMQGARLTLRGDQDYKINMRAKVGGIHRFGNVVISNTGRSLMWINVPRSKGKGSIYRAQRHNFIENWLMRLMANSESQFDSVAMAAHSASKTLVTAHKTGKLKFWEIRDHGPVMKGVAVRHRQTVALAVCSSSHVLSVGDGKLRYAEIGSQKPALKTRLQLDSSKVSVAISLGKGCFVVGNANNLYLVEIVGNEIRHSRVAQVPSNIYSIRQWQSRLIVLCDDRKVYLYSGKGHRRLYSYGPFLVENAGRSLVLTTNQYHVRIPPSVPTVWVNGSKAMLYAPTKQGGCVGQYDWACWELSYRHLPKLSKSEVSDAIRTAVEWHQQNDTGEVHDKVLKHLQSAGELLAQDKLGKALRELKKARELRPNSHRLLEPLVKLYHLMNVVEECAKGYAELGDRYSAVSLDKAIGYYQMASRFAPKNVANYLKIARLTKDPLGAARVLLSAVPRLSEEDRKTVYELAYKRAPKAPLAYHRPYLRWAGVKKAKDRLVNLLDVYKQQKNWNDYVACAKELVTLEKGDKAFYCHVVDGYQNLDKPEKQIAWAEKWVKWHLGREEWSDAETIALEILKQRGEDRSLLNCLETIYDNWSSEKQRKHLLRLGAQLMKDKNYLEAKRTYAKGYNLYSSYPYAMELGRAMQGDNKQPGAAFYFFKAALLATNEGNRSWFKRAIKMCETIGKNFFTEDQQQKLLIAGGTIRAIAEQQQLAQRISSISTKVEISIERIKQTLSLGLKNMRERIEKSEVQQGKDLTEVQEQLSALKRKISKKAAGLREKVKSLHQANREALSKLTGDQKKIESKVGTLGNDLTKLGSAVGVVVQNLNTWANELSLELTGLKQKMASLSETVTAQSQDLWDEIEKLENKSELVNTY